MKKSFLGLLLLAFLFGCGSSQNFSEKTLSDATDVPEAFQPEAGVNLNDTSCKSPMVDPRNGAEIIMMSSQGVVGDYKVPEGMYGVKKNELLRVNCSNGKVIGIVKN